MLSKFFPVAGLLMVTLSVAGCYTTAQTSGTTSANSTGTTGNTPINCTELKRQQLYQQTNMNTETDDTTDAQRQALNALIAKNCQ